MDLHLLSSQTLIVFLIFILLVLRTLRKGKSKPQNPPPGPWKLPIIGNMHNMGGSPPHHKLRELADKYGPLMQLQVGEVTTVVASSPEIARELTKTHDVIFAQRPSNLATSVFTYGLANMGSAPYGEQWRQMRRFSTLELLSAKRVRSFQSIREEETLSLLDNILSSSSASPENGTVDLSRMLASTSCSITAKACFGEKCQDQEAFIGAVEEFTKMNGGFYLGNAFPSAKWLHVVSGFQSKLEKEHQKIDRILEKIIGGFRDRSRKLGDHGESNDFVSVMLKCQEEGNLGVPLTSTNVKAFVLDMFAGGSVTSSTVLEWTMSELLKNPRVMGKVQAEVRGAFDGKGRVDAGCLDGLTYLNAVIKEDMRLHPPIALIPRECRDDCKIKGYDVPAKAKVMINLWALGRHPDYWAAPEKFYPERFVASRIEFVDHHYEFMPFGAGRRMCPGLQFGATTVQLVLASLLFHFDWSLGSGQELDMAEEFGTTVKRKNHLRATPTLRRPIPSVTCFNQ